MPLIPPPHPHDFRFAPQAELPFTTKLKLPPASLERTVQLGQATLLIYRELRKLTSSNYAAGVRFPNPLDLVLRQLELDLDHLQLILNASNIPNWADPSTEEPQPPAQDGRSPQAERLDSSLP